MGVDVDEKIVAAVTQDGMIMGGEPIRPGFPPPAFVRVLVDGFYWATVPTRTECVVDEERWTFSCRLPPVASPQLVSIDLYIIGDSEAGDGQHLLHLDQVDRQVLENQNGLSAHDVYSTVSEPMFAAPWMSFDGSRLTISGSHLPPGGDPAQLSVRLSAGVTFEFCYGLEAPEFGRHFWFWPNAHLSNFILTIDLCGSAPESWPFHFDFIYAKSGSTLNSQSVALRQRVWIPTDLKCFIGYPVDTTQLTRVQTWSSAQSVTFTGYNVFKFLETVLFELGVKPGPGKSIMDWGCGHGRVTRHFIDAYPAAHIVGVDIDRENIEWCQKNLRGGDFYTAPLFPPCELATGSLDAVFGISVVTHLSAEAQSLWLSELARLLKPGGYALLSFGGPSAAAWGSFWHQPEWWAHWRRSGFDDTTADPALSGKIDNEEYYRVTVQSRSWTRSAWSQHFDFVTIVDDGVGNQDVAVLKRKQVK